LKHVAHSTAAQDLQVKCVDVGSSVSEQTRQWIGIFLEIVGSKIRNVRECEEEEAAGA
jgi:hypothetical protein